MDSDIKEGRPLTMLHTLSATLLPKGLWLTSNILSNCMQQPQQIPNGNNVIKTGHRKGPSATKQNIPQKQMTKKEKKKEVALGVH